MSNNLNLTPDIETKLRNKLDDIANDRHIFMYKQDLMHQLDIFIKSRHGYSPGDITIINDDEPDLAYDYQTAEDAKKRRSEIRHANIVKPNIIFSNILADIPEIYDYIRGMLANKKEYAEFEVDAELTNKKEYLDAVELIDIIALFCITSDPDCLENDIRYYIRENPCYASVDFDDPFIKDNIKKFTGVDI